MHKKLAKYFSIEMLKANKAFDDKHYELAFSHLERAHILAQKYTKAHVATHWWMFKIGVKRSNIKEVLGQSLRIVSALLFSKIWVPKGNTGGTNVSAFKAMAIPEDLAKILEKYCA